MPSSGTTFFALLIVGLSGFIRPPAVTAPWLTEQDSDELAVRHLWSALDASWNTRQADRFSRFFTPDASFQFVDRGEALEGRAAIRETFVGRFSRLAPELRHLTTVQELRAIAPDVHAVDGTVEILQVAPTNAAPTILRTFAIHATLVRVGETWQIRVLRAYQLQS